MKTPAVAYPTEHAQSQALGLLSQPLQFFLVFIQIQEVEADSRSFGENLSREQIRNQDPGRVAGRPARTSNQSVETFKTSSFWALKPTRLSTREWV